MSAGATRIECGGVRVDAVGPSRVGGDKPALEVPEHPPGDSPEDRADGAGRKRPAGVGKIRFSHLPVDPISAAGAKAAEGQIGGPVRANLFFPGLLIPGSRTRVFVGEGDVNRNRPRSTADQITGLGGQFAGEAIPL